MALPQRVSMTLAWAFIGTSMRTLTKPNRNAHAASRPNPGDRRWVKGRAASASATSGPEILSARPVPPILGGSTPATGMAARPPAPAARSTIERLASERPNSALISGIATAHAPMQRPLAKKIAVTPARARTRPLARAASIAGEKLICRSLQHGAPGRGNHGFRRCAHCAAVLRGARVSMKLRAFVKVDGKLCNLWGPVIMRAKRWRQSHREARQGRGAGRAITRAARDGRDRLKAVVL